MTQHVLVPNRYLRRGATAVMALVCMVVLLGFAALSIDVGIIQNNRSDLQRTADAAALGGIWELLDNDRLKGDGYQAAVFTTARSQVDNYALRNKVMTVAPQVASGDISLGYLSNSSSGTEDLSFADPDRFNSVQVRVRRDEESNGAINLWFARVFGKQTTTTGAQATASFWDGVVGFRATDQTGNAELLPFALKTTAWNNLLAGISAAGDRYSYNAETGAVTSGADGILELNLYPGSGGTQLPPGNFGTVDIGNPSNSTADLTRQIRYGVNQSDLAFYGGALELGDDGFILLNGDTGLSAGIKDDLAAILGKPRAVPLFTSVSGPGNNSQFTVVGFAGIRIMYVKMTGAMSGKAVIIQPAFVVDDSAITGSNTTSRYVYSPPRLTR